MALLATGCAVRSTYRPPATTLERSILLEEIDEYAKHHPLSAQSVNGTAVERVPLLARVDENSSIRVAVRPALAPSDSNALPSLDDLTRQVRAMRDLLVVFAT